MLNGYPPEYACSFHQCTQIDITKTIFSYKLFNFGYYLLVYLFICPPISSFLFFLFHYYIVCYKNKSAKISKRKYFYFSFR